MNRNLKKIIGLLPLSVLAFFYKYYLKINHLEPLYFPAKKHQIDNKGIPFVKYGIVNGIDIGTQRNPITTCTMVDYCYNKYQKTSNEKFRRQLINNADWLIENAVKRDDYLIFRYNFPWPKYDIQKPWYSGMAQGRALQALIKVHKVTNDQKYIDAAKLLLKAFYVEVNDGGVTYKSEDNGWWYEEYAAANGKVSHVLNGMMYTLLGMYEFYDYTKDPDAKILFDKGIISLKNNLPKYDDDGFSLYDLLGKPSGAYHPIHIDQLKQLFIIINENIFKQYADKWNKVSYYQYNVSRIFRNKASNKKSAKSA